MIADLLDEFQAEAQEYYKVAWSVERAVKNTPMTEYQRDAIRYRYIDGMTWDEVARAMQYSDRQCRRFECDALNALGITNYERGEKDKDVLECPGEPVL